MDIPLVAIEAPPSDLRTLLRRHWDATEAVLIVPWSAAPTPGERRAIEELVARLSPRAWIRVDTPGSEPARVPLGTNGQPEATVPATTAVVIATSGSTGTPKGVVLSHAALEASTTASLARLGAATSDRFTLALPAHHVAGLQVLLRAWACGTEPVVVDAGSDELLADRRPGHVSLVPTQLRRIVDRRPDTLRDWTILVGGGPVDADVVEAARTAGARVVTSYGMTETCGGCVYDGVPLDGVLVDVRTDGRIRIGGTVLFDGYLEGGRDSAPRVVEALKDGWFVTGDVGRMVDGRLEVAGRVDDVVVTGGENVPAGLVAATLRRHPQVADAAVVGVPDGEWGQIAVAVVVPRGVAPELAALRAHVASSHPGSHAPRGLVVVDRVPRDGMGKPDRAALEALATGYSPA